MRNHLLRKRPLRVMLAAAMLACGFAAREARAVFVPLSTTLDQLTPAGNFTTVQNVTVLSETS
jgi:hypothetical protein